MRNFLQVARPMGAVAWGLFAAEGAKAYCATCQTTLSSSVEGQQLAASLNGAILFLLAAPLVVSGTVLFLMFRNRLRTAAQRITGFLFLQSKSPPIFIRKTAPAPARPLPSAGKGTQTPGSVLEG